MIDIGIRALPNQSLSIQIEQRFYEIVIKEVNGMMGFSLTRDGEEIIKNVRITGGTPLLPYRYQESGNFVMITDEEALPYWDKFGVTQFLMYLTPGEMAEARGGLT